MCAALESFDKHHRGTEDEVLYGKRIGACVDLAGDVFRDLMVEDPDDWSKRVKELRNDLAHHRDRFRLDGSVGGHLISEQLYWLFALCMLRVANAPDEVSSPSRSTSSGTGCAARRARPSLRDQTLSGSTTLLTARPARWRNRLEPRHVNLGGRTLVRDTACCSAPERFCPFVRAHAGPVAMLLPEGFHSMSLPVASKMPGLWSWCLDIGSGHHLRPRQPAPPSPAGAAPCRRHADPLTTHTWGQKHTNGARSGKRSPSVVR